ncbi:MAG TPA: hypothetical protein VGI47_04315 [Candidatus Binataceae bacterium]
MAYGLCAVALVLAYQALLVHRLDNNWTSLFCAGANLEVPPPLLFEHIHQIPNSNGYDGEFYHYVAHDPFFTRGFASSLDAPRVRYQRILLPLLAYLLAAGRDRFVDRAYFAVNLAFVFLGAYWLSRYSVNRAHRPAWGLAFIALPAVLVSNDRMTVDGVLTALCVGFLLYSSEGSNRRLYLCLTLAALTRETGFLLVASYCLWLLSKRRLTGAVWFATSALPALGWYLFVWSHTPYRYINYVSFPFAGLIIRLLHPTFYRLSPSLSSVAIVCDYLALTGVVLALVLSMRLAFAGARDPRAFAIYLFALLTILLADQGVWVELIAYGRALTPLFLFLASIGFEDRRVAAKVWFALPITVVTLPLLGARAVFLLNLAPSMVRP